MYGDIYFLKGFFEKAKEKYLDSLSFMERKN
jgi:hypothetical protein